MATSQAIAIPVGGGTQQRIDAAKLGILKILEQANKELWLLLSMFVIMAMMNFLVDSQRMVLGFYTFPTLFSAYSYGRRHATLTAFGSVLIVVLFTHFNPVGYEQAAASAALIQRQWLDITVWGGTLVLIGYLMGTLHEHQKNSLEDLRSTYHGVLMILRHFISKDKYTENHSYRVSVYATKIAAGLDLSNGRIEDIRAAALLHDIGKLDISRDLLYKAARLTSDEFNEIKTHVNKGITMLEPIGGSLRRILPIILSHHDKFDGSGYNSTAGKEIPLESRIISVADVYDSLTSDRPYRKAMSPFEAKEILVKGSGTDFDPMVVEAFNDAFRRGEMEVSQLIV